MAEHALIESLRQPPREKCARQRDVRHHQAVRCSDVPANPGSDTSDNYLRCSCAHQPSVKALVATAGRGSATRGLLSVLRAQLALGCVMSALWAWSCFYLYTGFQRMRRAKYWRRAPGSSNGYPDAPAVAARSFGGLLGLYLYPSVPTCSKIGRWYPLSDQHEA